MSLSAEGGGEVHTHWRFMGASDDFLAHYTHSTHLHGFASLRFDVLRGLGTDLWDVEGRSSRD